MVGVPTSQEKIASLVSNLVEHPYNVLRMDRFLAGPLGREFVEALTRLFIVFQRSLQMFVVVVLGQFWQKSSQSRPGISHKAVVNLGASSQLFSADIDLDDRGILREKRLVRKIGPDHEQ